MATINEILGIGKSGLDASKSLLALASFNVANASTPGYARRVADLTAGSVLGFGVQTGDPVAVKNLILQKNLAATMGDLGFHQGKLEGLQLAAEAFDDLDGVGIQSSLDAFGSALSILSANPGGAAERQGVLGAAEQLAASFAATREQLQTASDATVSQAQGVAVQVSFKAQQIVQLNAKIKAMAGDGQDIGTLVDQRDALIAELSSLIDVQVVPQTDGTVRIFTSSGQPIVSAEFATTFSVTAVGPPPSYEVSVVLTKGDGTEIGALQPVGGQLGGLVAAQNEELGPALNAIDEAAFFFMAAFNVQHQVGFGADGSTGLDFFELPATVEGAASQMALSDDVAGQPDAIAAAGSADEVPGGNGNLAALQIVAEQPAVLPSGLSIEQALEGLAFGFGEAVQAAELGASIEEASALQLETLLQSQIGVSVDEELIAMSRANQAFEAASVVIRRVDEMATTLLDMVR